MDTTSIISPQVSPEISKSRPILSGFGQINHSRGWRRPIKRSGASCSSCPRESTFFPFWIYMTLFNIRTWCLKEYSLKGIVAIGFKKYLNILHFSQHVFIEHLPITIIQYNANISIPSSKLNNSYRSVSWEEDPEREMSIQQMYGGALRTYISGKRNRSEEREKLDCNAIQLKSQLAHCKSKPGFFRDRPHQGIERGLAFAPPGGSLHGVPGRADS